MTAQNKDIITTIKEHCADILADKHKELTPSIQQDALLNHVVKHLEDDLNSIANFSEVNDWIMRLSKNAVTPWLKKLRSLFDACLVSIKDDLENYSGMNPDIINTVIKKIDTALKAPCPPEQSVFFTKAKRQMRLQLKLNREAGAKNNEVNARLRPGIHKGPPAG